MLVDVAPTMWPGSEFHASITRLEKKTSVVLVPILPLASPVWACVLLIFCRSC